MTGLGDRLVRPAATITVALWAVTGGSMLLVGTIDPLRRAAAGFLGGLGLDLQPSGPSLHALIITRFAGNVRVALLPLLLTAIGAWRRPVPRTVSDIVVAGTLTLNAMLVGAALGVHGTRLMPFLPHLPLEWTALAVCGAPWLLARHGSPVRTDDLVVAAAAGVLLLGAAAVVETFLTPRP